MHSLISFREWQNYHVVYSEHYLLSDLFTSQQVDLYVAQLCEYHSDANKFKVTLRDFLIQLREYSGQDTEALFIDDKLDEQRRKADAEREAAMKVPGMLKPSQLDQDEDL